MPHSCVDNIWHQNIGIDGFMLVTNQKCYVLVRAKRISEIDLSMVSNPDDNIETYSCHKNASAMLTRHMDEYDSSDDPLQDIKIHYSRCVLLIMNRRQISELTPLLQKKWHLCFLRYTSYFLSHLRQTLRFVKCSPCNLCQEEE